jgi:3-oxoadipate enol-lactonase
MPFAHSPYADVYFEQQGAGPDIVWLSAGDMPGSVWHEFQTPAFAEGFRQTTYDARGIGQTVDNAPDRFTIEEHAADAAAVLEAACDGPAILIGLSMGSLIAQELASTRPDLVRAAIVMGTCVKKTGFIREWEEAEIAFRRAGHTLTTEMAIAHYAMQMYPANALGDDEIWKRIRPIVEGDYGNRDGLALAAQWEACLDYDSTDKLPNSTMPIHVVSFSEDMQTPPQRGREVARLAPHGVFHLIEGLGHASAFGHRPDKVNEVLVGIVDDIMKSEAALSV